MPSYGKDLSGNDKMCRDSDNEDDGGSGGGGRDKRGDNGRTLTSSGGSLTLASGDGNTSGGAVTIDGGGGSTALGGSITILSGVGTATSSGSVGVLTSNAGTVGMSGDLLWNTGTACVGDRLFEDGELPSNGEDLSGDDEMSMDSNDDNDSGSGGGGRDKRGYKGRTLTSSGGSLILASGDGNTSGGAVTIDGSGDSTASGRSITISLGIGTATSLGSMAVSMSNAETAGMLGDLLWNIGTVCVDDRPFEDREVPSIGEDLSGNNKMSKTRNIEDDGRSGGGGRDKRGDNVSALNSSGGSLSLASGNGNTSGGAVTIDGGGGSTALGGFINISSGIGRATSLGSVAVSTSNAGNAGVLGDLSWNNGAECVGDSGALGIWSGSSASGLGGIIEISVGLGTSIGGAFSVTAGNLSGAAGGDLSIIFG